MSQSPREDFAPHEVSPLLWNTSMENTRGPLYSIVAGLLLALMAILAGGAALRESVTIDEVTHIGAGVSYLQKLVLRLNEEHPPLPKVHPCCDSSAGNTCIDPTDGYSTFKRVGLHYKDFFAGHAILPEGS
jgi:hypothetical protein